MAETGCATANGTTAYQFQSNAFVTYNDGGGGVVTGASWSYSAADPDMTTVPNPAKNNVVIKLMSATGGTTYATYSSTDDQDFLSRNSNAFYGFDPEWGLPADGPAKIEFRPAFDKRNVPDVHCTADTPTTPRLS